MGLLRAFGKILCSIGIAFMVIGFILLAISFLKVENGVIILNENKEISLIVLGIAFGVTGLGAAITIWGFAALGKSE